MVRGEWVREAASRVQSATNDLVAANDYESARRLSDLQSRVLFAPLLAEKRRQGIETPAHASAAGPSGESARSVARPSRPATTHRGERQKHEGRGPRIGQKSSRSRIAALAAALLVLVAAGAYQLLAKDPHAVRVLSEARLRDISPLLVSGYRSEGGQGLMFIGTFADEWQRLTEPARRKVASRVQAHLYENGVFEIILFDRKRVLQVHYVGELNTFPGWDS